jgi:hypothetical protein
MAIEGFRFRAIREFRGSRTALVDNSLKVQLGMRAEIVQDSQDEGS